MRERPSRGISPGTLMMLLVTVLVIGGFAVVLPMLSAGGRPSTAQVDAQTGALLQPRRTEGLSRSAPATAAPTAAPAPAARTERAFTLAAGGTVAVEKNVRQSGYFSSAKKYDYDEVLSLLRDSMEADLSLVSLENLTIPGAKVSELVVPVEVMRMLALGGADTVALGFGRAWEQGTAGVAATRSAAQSAGLQVIGAFAEENEAETALAVREIGGIRVALMHFTQTPSNRSKTNLKKEGKPALLPLTDDAPERIAQARRLGAQAVIVSVHWGSEGKTAPTAAQRKIAQAMAEAGADVILGSGARRVQPAEWLPGPEGRNTLCLWDLGCLLSDSRGDGAVAGMLARITFRLDGSGQLRIENPVYIPTYQWRFSLDGAANYRVIPALGDAPDGMDSAQQKSRTKARERVEKIMKDGSVAEASE